MQAVLLGGIDGFRIGQVVHGAMAPRAGLGADVQRACLRAALDAGVTAVDTAPLYGFGQGERLVGEVLGERPGGVRVLTKVGLRWDGDHGRCLLRAPGPDGRERTVRCDSRPASVRRDVEESLQRLGTEVLDLVQVHHPDEDTPFAETLGELVRLREEGKLLQLGVSNFGADQLDRAAAALGAVPLASVQLRHNLLDRTAEAELLPRARARGCAVLAYSPLERGWLGGARRAGLGELRLRRALALLRAIAADHGASPARVALAWGLGDAGADAVVVGARTPSQAADSARAAELRLADDERAALGEAFAGVRVPARSGAVRRTLARARRVAGRVRRRLSSREADR